jgi:hypothetical protein
VLGGGGWAVLTSAHDHLWFNPSPTTFRTPHLDHFVYHFKI